MADEVAILSAVLYDRKAYDTIVDHIDPGEFTALGQATYETVTDYYEKDPDAKVCDKDIVRTRLNKALPKQLDALAAMFKEIAPERGAVNVVHEVLDMKRVQTGGKLSMMIAAGKTSKEIAPVLDKYQVLNDATELGGGFKVLDKTYAELMRESGDPATPIPLFPREINSQLRGGVLPGHTFVIIGRVNVGKSALMIYNIAGQLREGKKVLLIENEDLPDDVKRRVGCCIVGCSMEWAETHAEQFEARCLKYGGENLIIPDPVPSTVREVARAVDHFQPDVCYVNQVRHMAPTKDAATDNTGAVDRVAQQLRALGKRTRTVMGLIGAAKEGQVDKDGNIQEKAVLQMSDSYGSRTGIPGCADVMIGIGTNEALDMQGKVAVSLCKNKRKRMKGTPVIYQHLNGENCRFTSG
jgi:hypothetical protein